MSGSPLFAFRCTLRDRDESSVVPLTKVEFDTLVALSLFADAETCECEVGAPRLGKVMVRDERTVRAAVWSLAEKGWLVVEVRAGRPWRFRLVVPDGVDSGRETRGDSGRKTRGAATYPGRTTRMPRAPRPDTPGGTPDEEVGSSVRRRRGARATTSSDEPAAFREQLAALNGSQPVGSQRDEMLQAYLEAPEGFSQCAVQAKSGKSPLGLLTRLIRHDVHLELQAKRAQKSESKPVCPNRECGLGGGEHIEGCPLSGVAA